MKKHFKRGLLCLLTVVLFTVESKAQIITGSYLRIADTSAMLTNYLRKSDTSGMLNNYARKQTTVMYTDTLRMLDGYARKYHYTLYTDTAFMLSGYARRGRSIQYSDSTMMLAGYALKGWSVQYADTSSMLSPYLLSSTAAGTYATKGENSLKVNYTDTAVMLGGYSLKGQSVQYADTSSMLSPYLLSSTAAGTYATKGENSLKVNYTDTAAMLGGYSLKGRSVQYADTSSMLSPYLLSSTAAGTYATKGENSLKVNYTDTAAMLGGYSLKGRSVQYADTSSMLSPYLLSSAAAGTYATKGENSLKVNYTDTAVMLGGYSLKGQSVQYADTSSMLSAYLLSATAAATYATQTSNALKVNYTDTAAMLSGYALRGQSVQQSEVGSILSPYLLSATAAATYATQANNALKVNYTDTAAMLSGYALRTQTVQQSEVGSLLSPYLLSATAAATYATQANNALKINYTDTAAMLSGYALRTQTVQQSEVGSLLSPYLLSATAAATYATQANNALKVNYTDTAALLQGYVRLISNSSPVMGGVTLNGMLNGTQASFSNTVHLAKENGVVVIGNVNPASHKLAVDGSIGARKVVINSPENWSDFVFDNDYSLRPLSAVESFIKKNKHLPDVPSEKEVKEKGINVADMQAVLLRKIEELTLYIIELEKKMKHLDKSKK
jgi:hypothetical protein